MTAITLAQINTAIKDTLETASGILYGQNFDELTESIPDDAILQVYPQSGLADSTTNTDRKTFKGQVRTKEYLFRCDVYTKQRSDIGEDMGKLLPLIDAVEAVLEQQDVKPYFGLDGIKAFKWMWERVEFEYATLSYVGARFELTITVF